MNIPEQLTLFPRDILNDHASPLVLPGTEKARKMTVTSGQKLLAYYRNSGPIGLLVKTLAGTSHWGSTTCYLTWKASATPRNRLLFRLVPSMLRTEETGYSLWPTPTANDGNNITFPPAARNWDSVPGEIMRRFYPTPTASQDYKPIRKLAPSEKNGDHGTMLVGAIGEKHPELIGKSLNPQFSEWLMGFPITWTELEPSETQ